MQVKKTTRNAQGGGTIRQRKDGRWEARYTLGRNPGTGKQVQKSVYGDTQAAVRKKLAQAIAAIDQGAHIEPSRLTVGAWLDTWLSEYAKPAVKHMTHDSYMRIIKNHIKPSLGATRLSALSAPLIQSLYNELTNKGLSAKTVKNIHGVLHRALQQAVSVSYLSFNPADACILPRMVKKSILPLDDYQITALLEAIRGHQYETLYMVALFSGMRQSEIIGLKWDCVDFKAGTILIKRQLQKERVKDGKYFLSTVKNDKSRIITPAPSIMAALHRHNIEQKRWRLKAGSAWVNDDYVFTNGLGGHLRHGAVYKNYKQIVDSLGLPASRFHDLRHTYAVAALQSGDDIKTVQENLGHHSAAFTLDVYGHVTERMKRESSTRMESFIKGLKVSKG